MRNTAGRVNWQDDLDTWDTLLVVSIDKMPLDASNIKAQDFI